MYPKPCNSATGRQAARPLALRGRERGRVGLDRVTHCAGGRARLPGPACLPASRPQAVPRRHCRCALQPAAWPTQQAPRFPVALPRYAPAPLFSPPLLTIPFPPPHVLEHIHHCGHRHRAEHHGERERQQRQRGAHAVHLGMEELIQRHAGLRGAAGRERWLPSPTSFAAGPASADQASLVARALRGGHPLARGSAQGAGLPARRSGRPPPLLSQHGALWCTEQHGQC